MARQFNPTPQVSRIMSAVRSTETTPEVMLRKQLWKMGVRGYRKNVKLPGKPDLFFPNQRLVVFVDGCIWHGCPIHGRQFRKNVDYWTAKITRNQERDRKNTRLLEDMGFTVLRFWEHDIMADAGKVAEDVWFALGRDMNHCHEIGKGSPLP